MSSSLAVGGAVRAPQTVVDPPGRVANVLAQAEPQPDATHGTVVAADGYRASIPLETLRSGGTLSQERTGLRLRIVEGRTLCWNVKDVVAIEVTAGKAPDDIPDRPSH